MHKAISVATLSKAWVCGRSLPCIPGSNSARDMDVCLLCVSDIVRKTTLRRADHSSGIVLLSVVFLSVIAKPRQ